MEYHTDRSGASGQYHEKTNCLHANETHSVENQMFDQGEILPIEEYVKYIMIHFQHRLPDTELSKRLGISRKSLWEKRKKYGIVKKK